MPYPTQWADFDPGKFMCCLCFSILDVDQCATDEDGELIDECKDCYEYYGS